MKKHFSWIVTFVVAMSLVFCFVGCKQSVSPESPIENPDNEVIAELKPIGFKISLPASKNSRAYYSQDDASYYVVKLSFDGSVISTQNGTPGQTLTFTVEKEGTYTINVEAYNTEKTLIAEGGASKAITFADGYVSLVISLKPKEKDPSNPSVTNKVDIGVDIQWVQPESKVLTVQSNGNSYFRRWNSDTSLGNTVVLEFTSGMTLREIFEVNDVSFRLDSYEKNGKKYEFCSYYIDSNGNEYYEHSMLTEDITLFPEFRVVPKVTFNLNGGIIDGDSSDKVYFTNWVGKYHPYQPTKDGLTFVGWTLTPDGEEFVTEIQEDITVFAKYIEPKSCKLTVTTNENSYFYNYSSGENLGTSIILEFTSGMTLEGIFKTNDIEYWLNDYSLDGREYEHLGYQDVNQNEYSSDSIILGDLELTAKYIRIPNIIFNLNGGNINGDTADVIQSPNVSLPIPVKEGYVIEAWTLNPDSDDYLISPDGEPLNYDLMEWIYEYVFEKGEDLTLYAKWLKKEYYLKGSMNDWGNEEVNPVKFTANEDGSYTIIYTAHEEQSQFDLSTIGYEYWFGGSEVTVDQDGFTIVSSAGNGNGKIVGQYPGNTYKMIAFFYDDYAEVKVETYEQNVSKMSISIPYYDQYFTMNYNGDYYYKTFYFEPEMITELGHTEVVINDDYQYYEAIFTVGETVKLVPGTSESKVIITGGEYAVEYELRVENIDGEYYVSLSQATQDYYIIGDITYGEWEKMIPTDEPNVYAYRFTYEAPHIIVETNPDTGKDEQVTLGMGAWSGWDGTANFKILAGKTWGANQVFKNAIVSSEYTLPDFSLDVNAQVNGLVDGLTYTIYLKLEDNQYFAKIE